MRYGWMGSLVVGLVVYIALQFVPATIHGNNRALLAGAVAFVASLLVRKYPRI